MALFRFKQALSVVRMNGSVPAVAAPRVARHVVPGRARPTLQTVYAIAEAPSTVKIILQGRKLQVTDAIKQYVESKVAHAVQRYAQILREIDVTVSARGGDTGTHGPKQQKVEVTIYTHRNGTVRVEDSESDLYASIDLVCDKIRQKLEKVKQKAIIKGKWRGRAGPHVAEDEDHIYEALVQSFVLETRQVEVEEARLKEMAVTGSKSASVEQVVRTKALHLDQALSLEDAVEAMEAIGHDFYIFKEKASGGLQVLYRRKSSGYGLLEPKL